MDDLLILTAADDLQMRIRSTGDAPLVFELVDKNRTYLRPWLLWVDETRSPDDSRKYIEECLVALSKKTKFDFGIWYGDTLVGSIGIFDIDEINQNAEIGYWLSEEYTGKGIMTRCVKRLIDFGFEELHLHRIRIRCAAENIRSAQVPIRLGFTLEGTTRESHFMYDRFVDDKIYGLLRDEWKA